MGNNNSTTQQQQQQRMSFASDSGGSIGGFSNKSRGGAMKEHKRHGIVVVKIMNTVNNRRSDNHVTHVVTPKGSVVFGSVYNPNVIQKSLASVDYPLLPPSEIILPDSRAHKLLVTHCSGGWHIIPFPEPFSRHSGTCLILGDRTITSSPYQIRIGDCFRLGSVGLVVSEMKAADGVEKRLDQKTLEFLKDESLAFDSPQDLAPLASEEEKQWKAQQTGRDTPTRADHGDDMSMAGESACQTIGSGGVGNGEKYICYMCYETHDTEDDALVAPCECKGDTRYLHVQCLQKWYVSSLTGAQTQVIRTTGNGAPACKICGSAYKTCFMKADGSRASLLETNNNGPYLSLVVVTKHDTNPGLFNTKFRLNFGEQARLPDMQHLTDEELNTITIGRSSSCNMILDYRTVSTIHARIAYSNGNFFLSDRRSSNGTMVYLQDPVLLPYSNNSMKLRMGRTTLSLQAKRNWTSTMRNALGSQISQQELESTPTAEEIQEILASSNSYAAMKEDLVGGEGEGDGTMAGDIGGADLSLSERNALNVRSQTVRTLNDGSFIEYPSESIDDSNAAYLTPQTQRGINLGSGYATRESAIGENRFSPRGTMLATEMIADVAALSELEHAENEALAHEFLYDAGSDAHQINVTSSPPHGGGRIMEAISNSTSPSPVPVEGSVQTSATEPGSVLARGTRNSNTEGECSESTEVISPPSALVGGSDQFNDVKSSEVHPLSSVSIDEPTVRVGSRQASIRLDPDNTGEKSGASSPSLRTVGAGTLVLSDAAADEVGALRGASGGGAVVQSKNADEEYLGSQVPIAGAFTAYGQIVERRSTPTSSQGLVVRGSIAEDATDSRTPAEVSHSAAAKELNASDPTPQLEESATGTELGRSIDFDAASAPSQSLPGNHSRPSSRGGASG